MPWSHAALQNKSNNSNNSNKTNKSYVSASASWYWINQMKPNDNLAWKRYTVPYVLGTCTRKLQYPSFVGYRIAASQRGQLLLDVWCVVVCCDALGCGEVRCGEVVWCGEVWWDVVSACFVHR